MWDQDIDVIDIAQFKTEISYFEEPFRNAKQTFDLICKPVVKLVLNCRQ